MRTPVPPTPVRASRSSWACRICSGDSNPRDPVKGWDKTWAFLKELNGCIEYYTSGTGAVMKELGEGSRDMTVTMTGWDINPRVLGIVPKNYQVTPFKNMTWVNDAHYMAIPKGLPPEKLAVVLDLMAFLLQPAQQALTYDKGYFYPGPAVKNVPLSMAPQGIAGRAEGIRPPGIRGVAEAISARAHARCQGRGRGVPALGLGNRRAEDQMITIRLRSDGSRFQ